MWTSATSICLVKKDIAFGQVPQSAKMMITSVYHVSISSMSAKKMKLGRAVTHFLLGQRHTLDSFLFIGLNNGCYGKSTRLSNIFYRHSNLDLGCESLPRASLFCWRDFNKPKIFPYFARLLWARPTLEFYVFSLALANRHRERVLQLFSLSIVTRIHITPCMIARRACNFANSSRLDR